MADLARVYRTTILDETGRESGEELRSRWTPSDIEKVRAAVSRGDVLPSVYPPLNLSYLNKNITVEDLRGISLSGLNIGGYDLAYCALDYATFDNSLLTETRLQYSRLYRASFRSATLRDVQASPIDAGGADFSSARLQHCYFSHANLDGVLDQGIEVDKSDFIESSRNLTSAPYVQNAISLSGKDIDLAQLEAELEEVKQRIETTHQRIAELLDVQGRKMGFIWQIDKAPNLKRTAVKILHASEKSGHQLTHDFDVYMKILNDRMFMEAKTSGTLIQKRKIRQFGSKPAAANRYARKGLEELKIAEHQLITGGANEVVTIGEVVSRPQSENVTVVVYMEGSSGTVKKPIKEYEIAGSTGAFSVGDKVEIFDLTTELQNSGVRKIRAKRKSTNVRSHVNPEHPIGWILGRKSE